MSSIVHVFHCRVFQVNGLCGGRCGRGEGYICIRTLSRYRQTWIVYATDAKIGQPPPPLSNTGCSACTQTAATTVVAVALIRTSVGVAERTSAAPWNSAGAADRKTCLQRSFPGASAVGRSNSIGGTPETRYVVYSPGTL